jgi:hypothetical protein
VWRKCFAQCVAIGICEADVSAALTDLSRSLGGEPRANSPATFTRTDHSAILSIRITSGVIIGGSSMRKRVILPIVFVCGIMPTLAGQQRPDMRFLGGPYVYGAPGSELCKQWRTHYQDPHARQIDEAWVLGFVSGAGEYAVKRFALDDSSTIIASIDKRCSNVDFSMVIEEAELLVADLEDRAQPRNVGP